MKYMVMECHPAYAVLMDEDSRFVRAANLRYTVGQTVTDPVLMDEKIKTERTVNPIILRCAAAAACLLVLSTAGFGLFRMSRIKKNEEAQSVIVMVERKRYEMKLNSSGEVISVQSSDSDGQNNVDSFDGKHISLSDMVHTILEQSLNEGQIGEDAPVQVYVPSDNEELYTDYKEQIENEAAKLSVNTEVKGLVIADTAPAPPVPDPAKDAQQHPEQPAPPPDKPNPEQPKDPAPPKQEPEKPTPPAPGKADPTAPNADKPEPPQSDTEKPEPPAHGHEAELPHPHEEAPLPTVKPQPKPDAAPLPAETEHTLPHDLPAAPVIPAQNPLP